MSETRSIVEEFQVPINRLNLVEVKDGINLDLRHPCQLGLVGNSSQKVLYDRSSSSRPTKRVRFDTVAVEVLPELVPDLPQAVVVCVGENVQDNSEIVYRD